MEGVLDVDKYSCGRAVCYLILIVYGLIALTLLLTGVLCELLQAYFRKLARDSTIGYLIQKKKALRKLLVRQMLIVLALSGIAVVEWVYYENLFICVSEYQKVELVRSAVLLKWIRHYFVVFANYLVFDTVRLDADCVHLQQSREKLIDMNSLDDHSNSNVDEEFVKDYVF